MPGARQGNGKRNERNNRKIKPAMRHELSEIEEIENYLEGKMGAEERTVFESRMKTDEQLRHNVKLQEQLTQRIKINAFRNDILNFHTIYTETATVKSKGYGFYLNSLLLFGVLGLVAASVYYFWPEQKETTQSSIPVIAQEKLAQQEKNNLVPGTTVVAEKNPNEPATAVRPDREKQKTKKEYIQDQKTFIPVVEEQLSPPLAEETPHRDFVLSTHTQQIDASAGGVVITKESKSVIHFPAGIMTDQEGNEVKGMVDIKYREYRNAAQMAFSQIPMVYSEGGRKYHFNSAGMFDIRAYQNGRELKIKPGAAFKVDYNATEKKDSCFFFVLDDKTNTWKKISPVQFKDRENIQISHTGNNPQGNGQIFIRIKDAISGTNISDKVFVKFLNPIADLYTTNIPVDSGYNVSSIVRGTYDMEISSEKGYRRIKLKDIKVFEGRITYVDVKMTPPREYRNIVEQLFQRRKNMNTYASHPSPDRTVKLPALKDGKWKPINEKAKDGVWQGGIAENQPQDSILGHADAGHHFPDMINGLRCESFGVYNCDQIYLLKSPVDITASYKNTAGEKIEDGYVVSMIDLNYNGAFSFDPARITCSRKGENVLLLFTRNKKLYALSSDAFKKMQITASGDYTFTMTDITSEVKNPEDLRQYLRLKK